MLNTVVWIPTSSDATGATVHAVAVDSTAATVKNSSAVQALVIANATTAPAGPLTFVAASSTNAGGVSLGTIPPNYCRAIWFRRTAANSAPLNNDGFTFEVDLDTKA